MTLIYRLAAHTGTILLLLLLAGVWLFSFPLGSDGPTHIYNARIVHALLFEPGSRLHEVYEMTKGFMPNWTITALLMGLLQLLPPTIAAKVIISLTLVLSFLAYRLFFGALSPRGNAGLFGILALFFTNTWFLWMGFWSFCLGTAIAVLAAWYARLRWPVWNIPRTIILFLATALVIVTHPIPALFLSGLLLLLLFEDPHGALRPAFPAPRHRAMLAVASLPFAAAIAFSGHGKLLNTSPRDILQAILYYPSEAFEVVRVPYVDTKYAIAALATVFLYNLRSLLVRHGFVAVFRASYLTGGFGLLIASVVLNDAPGGGAYLQARLALFSFVLLIAWLVRESEGAPWFSTVGAVVAVSCAFNVMALITVFRDVDAYTRKITAAIQAVQPEPDARFIIVRYPAPVMEKAYGLQRLRLPYIPTQAAVWASHPGFLDLTSYAALSSSFPNRLRLNNPRTALQLATLGEPSSDAHARTIEQLLSGFPLGNIVLIGEFGTDWTARPDAPGLFDMLAQKGFVLSSQQGDPAFLRIYSRPSQKR